jgi:cytidylate kinase
MSVITISRGSFSGGRMLAQCLSAALGYRCVDREVILERAAANGVSQQDLRDAIEKAPTFLERLKHKKYLYLALLEAALAEEVRTGDVVYHGNAGHLLLRGGPPVLRVRIIAPLESRLKMAQDRLRLTRAEAEEHIGRMDQERMKWARYLYGVDWGDPALYDVVVNLESMNICETCQGLATLARQQCFEFTKERRSEMEDLLLASRVKVSLAFDEATSYLEFDVSSKNGAVAIRGPLSTMRELSEVRRVAAAIEGVRELNLEELALPI